MRYMLKCLISTLLLAAACFAANPCPDKDDVYVCRDGECMCVPKAEAPKKTHKLAANICPQTGAPGPCRPILTAEGVPCCLPGEENCHRGNCPPLAAVAEIKPSPIDLDPAELQTLIDGVQFSIVQESNFRQLVKIQLASGEISPELAAQEFAESDIRTANLERLRAKLKEKREQLVRSA